jgi:hypothetical protein
MSRWIVALLVSGALLGGCGKKDEEASENAPAKGDAIGVEECDAYFTKAEACLPKAPPENKTAMQSAIKANREAWRDVAKNAANKDALKVGCKATLDAFIASNPGCE